jgi:hypothetical protein
VAAKRGKRISCRSLADAGQVNRSRCSTCVTVTSPIAKSARGCPPPSCGPASVAVAWFTGSGPLPLVWLKAEHVGANSSMAAALGQRLERAPGDRVAA